MNDILIKVDEAGRIIIPLKIRKKYKINKSDTLLLTTIPNGFKLEKEDFFSKYEEFLSKIKLIEKNFNLDFIITDNEKVIYTTLKYKNLQETKISDELKQVLNNDFNDHSKRIVVKNSFMLNSLFYYKVLNLNSYTKGIAIIIFSLENKKEAQLVKELLE